MENKIILGQNYEYVSNQATKKESSALFYCSMHS